MAYFKRDSERIKHFSRWLRDIAYQQGFKSQRQLALASGINAATINRSWNATQMPDEVTLQKLSRALNVEMEVVLQQAGYSIATKVHTDTAHDNIDEKLKADLLRVRAISSSEHEEDAKRVTSILSDPLYNLPN